jgi:hypothetical protein
MRKGQTALEYLMTYGWAILIVIIVVAALYALGLTKPCKWQANPTISLPPDFTVDPGSVKVWNDPNDAGQTHILFKVTNNKQTVDIDDNALTVTLRGVSGTGTALQNDDSWDVGEPKNVDIDWGSTVVTAGDCYTIDLKLTYKVGTSTYTWGGTISGVVAS